MQHEFLIKIKDLVSLVGSDTTYKKPLSFLKNWQNICHK